MHNVICSNVKLCKRVITKDLLNELYKHGIGTNEVEGCVNKLCKNMVNKMRNQIIVKVIMREKVKDAQIEIQSVRKQVRQYDRELHRYVQKNSQGYITFKTIVKSVTEKVWKVGKKKTRRKVAHLKRKYLLTSSEGNEKIRGIAYQDIELGNSGNGEEENSQEAQPKLYGGVRVSKEGMRVLSKSPNFMVLDKVDETEVEVEIEKGIMKARYEIMSRGDDTDEQERGGGETAEEQDNIGRHEPREELNKCLNYANLRATDIPTVQRLYPPEPATMWKEKAMENIKDKLMDTVREYKAEHCDKNGFFKEHNLNRQEVKAMKELKKDVKDKKMVVFTTDKSGKFAADTPCNYEEAVMKHTEKDVEIDEKKVRQIEGKINQHMRQFNKMFRVGSTFNHESRVTGATQSTNTPAPPLYGLRKDHKTTEDENVGPPVRPVCGANQAPNSRLSHFLSRIVNDYADSENIATECRSSEEMKAAFTEYNNTTDPEVKKRCQVISMDVKALYPSMEWEEILKAVREMIENSEKTVENVDWQEVGKYLAVTMSEKDIEKEGLQHVVPKRKGERRRKVTVAYLGQKKNDEEWELARAPGTRQKKKMIALVVAEGVKACLENHVYCVGNRIFRQQGGGPIGLELTGAVSRPFMAKWDKTYLEKVEKAGLRMHLYERYVDDSNQIAEAPPKGYRYDTEKRKMVKSQEGSENDDSEKDDERMARALIEIADEVMGCIKMEADMPSKNTDGKLPILDMKVWMNSEGEVMFQHYEKPMCSKAVLHKESAHPSSCKRSVHVQEIVRRLLNSSPRLDWKTEVAPVITEYMRRMKDAGYGERYRKSVLEQAIAIYDAKKEEEKNGQRPMYRPRSWQKEERRKKKRESKHDWSTKGGCIAPIFVPSSPGGELARRMKKVAEKEKKGEIQFKIVEMGGRRLKNELQKSNPLSTPGCEKSDCIACRKEKGKGGQCRRNNVNYEIECHLCKNTSPTSYIGETARNLYTRGGEHLQRRREEDSFMKKHMQEKHLGEEEDFRAKVTHVNKDCLTRQVREGVLIRRCRKELMNTRSEWFQPPLYRIRSEMINN